MNLTKKEFFKRTNRNAIYGTYEDTVSAAYDVSESYSVNLIKLKNLKDKYRHSTIIWKILDKVEKDCTSNFEYCAFLKCQELKQSAFTVNSNEYNLICTNIRRLSTAIGKMTQVVEFVSYLEHNNLTVRAK